MTGELYISSISTTHGSLAGGSILEISGAGFADEDGMVTTNSVSIGLPPAAPCRVLSASHSRIVCQTEPAGRMHIGAQAEVLNPVEVSVNGIYAQCRMQPLCTPGCNGTAAEGGASQKCCNFAVPDPEDMGPPPFIGEDQGYGRDNCAFYYTTHATPNVTGFSPNTSVSAGSALFIHGSMLNASDVYLTPMTDDGLVRWNNPFREDYDAPEAVMVPDMRAAPGSRLRKLTIVERNNTRIEATIPADMVMGSYLIVVWGASQGAAVMPSKQAPLIHVDAEVLSVHPAAIPAAGGLITVTGTGFANDREHALLQSNGVTWVILSSNATRIVAYSPGLMLPAASNLSVYLSHRGSHECGADSSTHSSVCTPPGMARFDVRVEGASVEVTAVNQTSPGAAVAMKLQVPASFNMTGTQYLTNRPVSVMFGVQELQVVVNTTDMSIVIPQEAVLQLPASPASGHPVFVMIDGNMTAGMRPMIHVPLNISAVSPAMGAFCWARLSCLLIYCPRWPWTLRLHCCGIMWYYTLKRSTPSVQAI